MGNASNLIGSFYNANPTAATSGGFGSGVQNMIRQFGMQPLNTQATNSPMKAVGGYWANPGYQQMQQRLYGGGMVDTLRNTPGMLGITNSSQENSVPYSGGTFGFSPVSQTKGWSNSPTSISNAVNGFQPVFNTSKSVAQPSSVTNPFANYRSMNMMPYWMALTRRFMGY